MQAVFIELPPFERRRQDYLDDQAFGQLQRTLLADPLRGDVIVSTGGLRKLRYRDNRRSKGERGGVRVICYWWSPGSQFWLFTVYDKDEAVDLTATEKKALKALLDLEVAARTQ